MAASLAGKVALVTGASRGIGKGVADVLVREGATVFITGREARCNTEFPSVLETAGSFNRLQYGKCIGIPCDHRKDTDVNMLFEKIAKESGTLDIVVNCAFGGTDNINQLFNKHFWEEDPSSSWDNIINAGLRSSYIISCKASKMMIPKKSGLIVNVSSLGGIMPIFGTLYGVGKEGTDRMSVEMGAALKEHNVTVLSLWPGVVRTEMLVKASQSDDNIKKMFKISEHPTLTGKAVLALANDPNLIKKAAKIHLVGDLAHKYGFKDVDGTTPCSLNMLRAGVKLLYPPFARFIPRFIKIPKFLLLIMYSKF